MFVNHNEVLVNPTPLGPHSKLIGLKAFHDAFQMPLDAGPSLDKLHNVVTGMSG